MMPPAPQRGDVVWIDFDPQVGREQSGRRPALILSPQSYNRRTGLALLCPITSKVKGYPYEVALPEGVGASGVILADQLKSFDWNGRGFSIVGRVSPAFASQVADTVASLLPISQ